MQKILYIAAIVFFLHNQCGYSQSKESAKYVNFDSLNDGRYIQDVLKKQWGQIEWSNLYDRAWIVSDANKAHGKVLRISYPKGALGSKQSGAQFVVKLQPEREYWLSYYVKFEKGFDFKKGGKLPGLSSGGSKYTGGRHPTIGDGWSARYMWRKGGKAVIYLYYVDMPGKWGQDLELGDSVFIPGKWHHLTQYIKVNDSNQLNGILEVWFDGKKVLSRSDIRFRIGNCGLIDSFLFSTFHGGNTQDWAPDVNSSACFDEFLIDKQRPVFKELNSNKF